MEILILIGISGIKLLLILLFSFLTISLLYKNDIFFFSKRDSVIDVQITARDFVCGRYQVDPPPGFPVNFTIALLEFPEVSNSFS